jgi:putative GTP pyrophosphokinase
MNSEEIQYYGSYAQSLVNTEQTVLKELDKILDELTDDPEHSPYEHIISRIKSAGSVRDKLERKGFPADALTGLRELSDIIGIRIVTHFVGDIYLILSKLREHENWQAVKEKDYIAKPKKNGYRSYHIIMKVPIVVEGENGNSKDGCPESIRIEIQLRTIAMDCWAALEHQMRYKKDVKNTALIADELKRCADEMASTDLTMQTIRDVLMKP